MPKQLLPFIILSAFAWPYFACSPIDETRPSQKEPAQPVATEPALPPIPGHSLADLPEYYQSIPDGNVVLHSDAAGKPAADGWCLAKSTHGNCSVWLPGKYRDVTAKATSSNGSVSIMHTVGTKTAKKVEFMLLHTELFGPRYDGYKNLGESMLEDFERAGHTVTSTKVVLANLPADRVKVSAPGTYADMIFISTPTDDYMLAVQTHAPIGEDLQKDIERFFESFEITKPASAAPTDPQ